MCEKTLWHATLVQLNGYGVLLRGKSGSGKSDLALRLIENKQATLVADDVVMLQQDGAVIIGKAPENIAGLLEVRGVGLLKYPHIMFSTVDLLVDLQENQQQIERLPEMRKEKIFALEIPQIDLYARENSATDKIVAAIRLLCAQKGG